MNRGNLKSIARSVLRTEDLQRIRGVRFFEKLLLHRRFSAYEMRDRIKRELKGCRTVLEIGAGLFEILRDLPRNKVRVGLEIFMPYIENRVCDERCIPIRADAMDADRIFIPRSFDAVMMIDVLEHFDAENALALLKKAETIARKKVIIFVPEGVHPQDRDDRGFGNDHYMTHRSTWYAGDLEGHGYTVDVWKDFHGLSGKDPNNMFCIKEIPEGDRTFGKVPQNGPNRGI